MIASRSRNPSGRTMENHMKTAPPLAYRGKEVDALLGIGKSTRYSWQDPMSPQFDPTWPVPKKISARSIVYIASEVAAWLESRPRTRVIQKSEGTK